MKSASPSISQRTGWQPILLAAALLLTASALPTRADEPPRIVTIGGGGHRMLCTDGNTFGHHVQWGPCKHDVNDLFHITFAKGLFVACGGWSGPRVIVSRDGVEWTEVDAKQFEGVRGAGMRVKLIDDTFYLITQGGVMLRSADAMTWEKVGAAPLARQPNIQRVRTLAFGNGVFVTTGDHAAVAVSRDMGRTWTVTEAPRHDPSKKGPWPLVEFGAARFVMCGQNGYLATSVDGADWKQLELAGGPYTTISNLTWTGREFLAVTRPEKGAPVRLVSTDGLNWTTRRFSPRTDPPAVWRFGTTYFGAKDDFFTGNARLYRSADGMSWEPLENPRNFSVRWMTSDLPARP